MPDDAEPPSPVPPGRPGLIRPRPPRAVLFDFHGTLAQVEDSVTWTQAAAAECGVALPREVATGLADRLVLAGRPGGPPAIRIPPRLAEVYAERDLDARAHRAAWVGLAATVDSGIDGLPEALYERGGQPRGWRAYADAAATLRAVKAAGLAVAVVSNIGFDIRPILDAFGMAGFIDEVVLSFEVGRLKPDPAIFQMACAALRADPAETLMVGDTLGDAGALAVGCAAYLVPAAEPGELNGLGAVAALARV